MTGDVDDRLFAMLNGYRQAQLVHLMAALGLADRLAAGARTGAELARDCGCDERALAALLRALVAEDLLAEGPDGYRLTDLGAGLRTGAPGRARRWALFAGQEQYRAWAGAQNAVRTGGAGFAHENRTDLWRYLADHPDRAELFGAALPGSAGDVGSALAAGYDCTPYRSVGDVGGGTGAVLAGVLDRYPHLEAVLFDLAVPPDPRWTATPGSFFGKLPAGRDLYLLCRVLGDWDDARAGAIVTGCRDAMRADSRLLVVERRTGPGALLDLHLLVMTGGGGRSPDQLAGLLTARGLRVIRTIPLDGTGLYLTEAARQPLKEARDGRLHD